MSRCMLSNGKYCNPTCGQCNVKDEHPLSDSEKDDAKRAIVALEVQLSELVVVSTDVFRHRHGRSQNAVQDVATQAFVGSFDLVCRTRGENRKVAGLIADYWEGSERGREAAYANAGSTCTRLYADCCHAQLGACRARGEAFVGARLAEILHTHRARPPPHHHHYVCRRASYPEGHNPFLIPSAWGLSGLTVKYP